MNTPQLDEVKGLGVEITELLQRRCPVLMREQPGSSREHAAQTADAVTALAQVLGGIISLLVKEPNGDAKAAAAKKHFAKAMADFIVSMSHV